MNGYYRSHWIPSNPWADFAIADANTFFLNSAYKSRGKKGKQSKNSVYFSLKKEPPFTSVSLLSTQLTSNHNQPAATVSGSLLVVDNHLFPRHDTATSNTLITKSFSRQWLSKKWFFSNAKSVPRRHDLILSSLFFQYICWFRLVFTLTQEGEK